MKQSVLLVRVLLQSTDGRDKILKMIQYACRLLLLLDSSQKQLKEKVDPSRLDKLAKQFSVTRKVIRLFHLYTIYLFIHLS